MQLSSGAPHRWQIIARRTARPAFHQLLHRCAWTNVSVSESTRATHSWRPPSARWRPLRNGVVFSQREGWHRDHLFVREKSVACRKQEGEIWVYIYIWFPTDQSDPDLVLAAAASRSTGEIARALSSSSDPDRRRGHLCGQSRRERATSRQLQVVRYPSSPGQCGRSGRERVCLKAAAAIRGHFHPRFVRITRPANAWAVLARERVLTRNPVVRPAAGARSSERAKRRRR
jgi:hypothetical protein